jgi:cell division protein FtsQ
MRQTDKPSRRSDEIRRRRQQQSHAVQKSTATRKHKVVAPELPPVMARVPLSGSTQAPRRDSGRSQKRGRRIYNVSLNPDQGAEMSLPALPRLALSWRIVSVLLVLGLGFALYQLWTSSDYRVDAAQVSGLQRVTSNDVNTALGVTGKPIFILDANKLETELLAAFPEFNSAEVLVKIPNTVMITVTERLPVMIWFQEGKSYLVDKDGLTFPIRHESAAGAFPVVEAAGAPPGVVLPDKPGPSLQEVTISKITGVPLPGVPAVAQALPLLSPQMVQSILLISQQAPGGAKLIYDPLHGLGWKDRRGWDVFLGDEQDIAVKLNVYRAILDHLKGTENRPVMISVEYVHAPYYRLEE